MRRIVREKELTYEVLCDFTDKLALRYPFSQLSSCGKSRLGRDIRTLSLGNDGDAVVYVGGVHGQEWLTSYILLRFFERLCEAYLAGAAVAGVDIREALNGRRLIMIPQLNPDGIQIALRGCEAAGAFSSLCRNLTGGDCSQWNANAAGVDLNHNFDAGWHKLREAEKTAGITGPAARRFGGEYPESEPETAALTRLCRRKEIRHAVAFHSQGEEIYWDYGKNTPQKSLLMAKIFSAVSGYVLVKNDGLCSHGGFKDWFIEELARPAFTVEMGKGKNPLPLSQAEDIYTDLEELMTVGIIM